MERKIIVVTDSACDLQDELLERYNIRYLPLRVLWKGKDYRDREEISGGEIYAMMDVELPKTSLPRAEDFIGLMDSIADEGYTDVLYLSISSGLSGSYNAVRLMAEEYDRLNIELFDTRSLSMGEGGPVLEAARIISAGGTMQEAVDRAAKVREEMGAYYVVSTLEYLRKGGRIGRVEGTIGTLLNIKPVVTVDEAGEFKTAAKNKGFRKAVATMLNEIRRKFAGKCIHLTVIHGEAMEGAKKLLEEVKSFATVKESFITQLCPTMAIHTGRGLLGIIAYEL